MIKWLWGEPFVRRVLACVKLREPEMLLMAVHEPQIATAEVARDGTGVLVGERREGVLVVLRVHEYSERLLANTVDARCLAPFLLCSRQCRKQGRCEQEDDCDNDKQLDEGKSVAAAAFIGLFHYGMAWPLMEQTGGAPMRLTL